jgi:acyl-CoA synthetase (AMP-forming)/AMP-acid ligase II
VDLLGPLTQKLFTARTLAQAGGVRPTRPDRLARVALALRRFGPTPAAGYTASASRFPGETAIVDELGTLTFAEVHRRTNSLAHALGLRGVREGDGVAIMCRNHRGFIEATVACSKLGAHALYLNTAFAGPQIAEVVEREGPVALIYDDEFDDLVHDAGDGRMRFIGWHDGPGRPQHPLLEDLVAEGSPDEVAAPGERGRVVILTSGTTGSPKGAQRKQPESLDPAAALLSMIPLRAREPTMIAAPMFHSWGFAHFTLGMALASTVVLRRRFDPEDTLRATAQHRCTALVVVPVMLQRILELPPATFERHDLRALRVIAASGSALPGELALRVMDRFGDVLYNLYGSTEVAWATIATPADLRVAPGTAGRPPRGTVVRIVDEDGRDVDRGATGRIFVGNELAFDGYTGGGGKQILAGLLSSGDVGHLDADGRLFIDGRDDEMIVSGGENVFPREVEDLLACHELVEEVAVVGVEDADFGQRLRAFVVAVRVGEAPSEDELKAYVRANLARYKVPREIVFLDELPRNATGKVLKRELAP